MNMTPTLQLTEAALRNARQTAARFASNGYESVADQLYRDAEKALYKLQHMAVAAAVLRFQNACRAIASDAPNLMPPGRVDDDSIYLIPKDLGVARSYLVSIKELKQIGEGARLIAPSAILDGLITEIDPDASVRTAQERAEAEFLHVTGGQSMSSAARAVLEMASVVAAVGVEFGHTGSDVVNQDACADLTTAIGAVVPDAQLLCVVGGAMVAITRHLETKPLPSVFDKGDALTHSRASRICTSTRSKRCAASTVLCVTSTGAATSF